MAECAALEQSQTINKTISWALDNESYYDFNLIDGIR